MFVQYFEDKKRCIKAKLQLVSFPESLIKMIFGIIHLQMMFKFKYASFAVEILFYVLKTV